MLKAILGVAALLFLVVVVIMAVSSDAEPMGSPVDPVGPPGTAKSALPLLGGFLWPRGPTSTWGDEPLRESFARAKEAGIGLAIWTYNWGELETKPNHFEWPWLDFLVNQTIKNTLKVSLSFEIAQPHRPPLYPPDIKEARFDDPVFQARLLALYEQLARRYKVRFQPVDATHWPNRSAGVSKSNVFLGRSLSCLATALSLAHWIHVATGSADRRSTP
jgi:hypothetical protein